MRGAERTGQRILLHQLEVVDGMGCLVGVDAVLVTISPS